MAADVSKLAERFAAQVEPLDVAATTLETEIVAIEPGQDRILDIIDADHDATGVAEEYLGGAVLLGASAVRTCEELATLSRTLEQHGRTFPPVEAATIGLVSAMRRVIVALEPAIGWGGALRRDPVRLGLIRGKEPHSVAQPSSSSQSSKSGHAAMSTPWLSGDASVHQLGTCESSDSRPPAASAAATRPSA